MLRVIAAALVVAASVVPVQAAPITWHAEFEVSGITDPFGLLAGLTVGTPWSLFPVFNPTQGDWSGLRFEGLRGLVSFSSPFQPAVIPEPGTWTLVGLGLAALARRRLRRRS